MKATFFPAMWDHICHEIQLHYKRPVLNSLPHISCPEDAESILRNFIGEGRMDLKEVFVILLLSNANNVLGVSEVSAGTITGVIIPIKEILQLALVSNAVAIIACHNHPSGSLKISSSDKQFTERLLKACNIMDISLLDHLILTSESYIAFSQEGLI